MSVLAFRRVFNTLNLVKNSASMYVISAPAIDSEKLWKITPLQLSLENEENENNYLRKKLYRNLRNIKFVSIKYLFIYNFNQPILKKNLKQSLYASVVFGNFPSIYLSGLLLRVFRRERPASKDHNGSREGGCTSLRSSGVNFH